MKSLNISLPQSLKAFIERKVADGRYSTASEFVRDLLRKAQQQEGEQELEDLLVDGLDSGPAAPITDDDWRRQRHRLQDFVQRRRKK